MLKIHLRKLILTGMLESERLHFNSARETEIETHFQRILYAQQICHLRKIPRKIFIISVEVVPTTMLSEAFRTLSSV